MKKILFVYPKKASFIEMDINILSHKYKVIENTYNWKKKILVPFLLIEQLIFLLKNIKSIDFIIISFGGYWALAPTLIGKFFKKPAFIILNGTDCASFKEIKYGTIKKIPLKFILKISYNLAKHLLPVSKSLIYTENTYFSKNKVVKQGIKYYFPKNTVKKTVISNAIDSNKWKILSNINKIDNRFITVLGKGQFTIKGGELIIEAANKFPQFEFYFVGTEAPKHLVKIPNNVKFFPRKKPDELLLLYNESKYYLQLSIFEGFGVALCESMLCGCIPIVSSVNALPYIVKDTGYILEKMDITLFSNLLIKVCSNKNTELGKLARERIIEKFSIKNRQDGLYRVLNE